ncbi:hypothetical protein GCM10009776_28910 [Microbacterium deminutum]|uniref:Uncharacterized protein n=1 Tax=Microbacterium deminutum TaxID=344164 RepID=A0ABN2R664_9MICO
MYLSGAPSDISVAGREATSTDPSPSSAPSLPVACVCVLIIGRYAHILYDSQTDRDLLSTSHSAVPGLTPAVEPQLGSSAGDDVLHWMRDFVSPPSIPKPFR